MTLNTLKRKVLPYALALGIGVSSIFSSGCIPTQVRAETKQEQVYNNKKDNNYSIFVRSPTHKKYNGSTYSIRDGETYQGSDGRDHFLEEATINNITKDNGTVEFGIAKQAFEYANNNQCTIRPALFWYDAKGNAQSSNDYIGDANENPASIKIKDGDDVNRLYVAVLCDHNKENYTERLASYPLKEVGKSYVTTSKNSKNTNIKSKPNKNNNNLSLDEQTLDQEDYNLQINDSDKYHLKTNCGPIREFITNGKKMPKDQFGEVILSEPKKCNVYLKEPKNTIEDYDIAPLEIEGNVLRALDSNNKKLTLDFTKEGNYDLIVSTALDSENDYLRFDVNEKPEIKNNLSGNLSVNLPQETEKAPEKTLEEMLYEKDQFNGSIGVKPFLRPRVNVVENLAYKNKEQVTINQMLQDEDRDYLPVVRIHQDNSLEFKINKTEDITYNPRLYKVTNFSKDSLKLEEVSLKQSKLNKNKFKISKKGDLFIEDSNLERKLVKFPYHQSLAGSYDELSGNLYLYTLVGVDKDGKLKDIDPVLIEIVANLIKEQGKGAAIGIPIGALVNSSLGNSISEGETILNFISNGTKTGGNIPLQ